MKERDELYSKFVKAIHDVQQKSNLKNLLLEKKLSALGDTLEKKEAQLNEVLTASNLDPSALSVVTRKLEVHFFLKEHDKERVFKSFFFYFRMYSTRRTVPSRTYNTNWRVSARHTTISWEPTRPNWPSSVYQSRRWVSSHWRAHLADQDNNLAKALLGLYPLQIK